MALSPNMFTQETVAGQVDLSVSNGGVVSAEVYASEAVPLVPGQAVKIVDSAGGVPKVTALAANTESTFGIVLRNIKDVSYPAKAPLEIGMMGCVVYMTSSAAIARGAAVEMIYTTNKVVTNAGVNPPIGIAYDKATGADQLIRVMLRTPVLPVYLDQLADVVITSVSTGEILKYDTNHWENAPDLTA